MDVQLAGEDFGTADREEALQEAGFEIRRATTEDEAGLVALCKDEGHLGWIAENLMALENVPVTIHVALCEEKIRAFATHGVIGPTHFGPMLTAADLRGQGIGSVLLERCLRDWQRAGHRGGEIIWAGPLSFYARVVGATIGKVFWTYHKELEETE
jgi:GNAT superfamily N-acetyltransferase